MCYSQTYIRHLQILNPITIALNLTFVLYIIIEVHNPYGLPQTQFRSAAKALPSAQKIGQETQITAGCAGVNEMRGNGV